MSQKQMIRRQGFTLIEVFVSIMILGLLMAILIPAALAARESMRRVQCQSHLRQIGIALQAYESVHAMYPPGQLKTGSSWSANRICGLALILPYLENINLYNSINILIVVIESPESPSIENKTARNTLISTYLCPSDGSSKLGNSYRFNRGTFGVSSTSPFDGPFSLNVMPTVAAITDGLSRTAFVSERLGGTFDRSRANRSRDIKIPIYQGPPVSSDPAYIPGCDASPVDYWITTAGRYWMYNGAVNGDYSHNGPPNDPRPTCLGGLDAGLNPARSYHSSCVNVLFGDGHVDSVSNQIDSRVWKAFGTHASGD